MEVWACDDSEQDSGTTGVCREKKKEEREGRDFMRGYSDLLGHDTFRLLNQSVRPIGAQRNRPDQCGEGANVQNAGKAQAPTRPLVGNNEGRNRTSSVEIN